jgi:multidrug resistance efflux pump
MRKLVLPLAAAGLLAFAVAHVVRSQQVPPRPGPPAPPPRTPFEGTVAATGVVEAETENIAVGSPLAGIVTTVCVKAGQRVATGNPLFRLDDRQLRAEYESRAAALVGAEAQLTRLEAMPRPEELPASEARVAEARANLIDQEDQLRRSQALVRNRAIGEEELVRRRQASHVAREQLARAEADYRLLRAGAWEPDKAVARAAVAQARAQLKQTQTDLERLEVRALVDGEVLQVSVRPGEYVGVPPGQALVVLGGVSRLHVRVDIDEHDIPRYRRYAAARAAVRGNPGTEYPLSFVRVEPFVVPKRSLNGDNNERVDTRVLQVLYALPAPAEAVYVGQQLDVFIEADAARAEDIVPAPRPATSVTTPLQRKDEL